MNFPGSKGAREHYGGVVLWGLSGATAKGCTFILRELKAAQKRALASLNFFLHFSCSVVCWSL